MIVACSASKLATPTDADVTRGSSQYADLSLDQLKHGRKLYVDNCGKCHKLYQPTDHPVEEWTEVVPHMVHEANEHGASIDEAGEVAILRYILTMRSS